VSVQDALGALDLDAIKARAETATRFNLDAAQDAQARLDEGVGQPGDVELAEVLEGFHQQEWDKFEDARYQAERAEWLAGQCPKCGPEGSGGEVCDRCFEDALGDDE
jgi:hypothetical protein